MTFLLNKINNFFYKKPKLLFVHIPKTAGTSFRKSLETSFGSRKVLYDYGIKSPETSRQILQSVYLSDSRKNLINENFSVISGHIPAEKYIPLIGVQNTISFFRDPVHRVYSEFLHHQRNNNYKGDIISYATKEKNKNTQSRYFKNIPLEMIGFIGLTEYYTESIEMLNNTLKINLPAKKMNHAPSSQLSQNPLSEETIRELTELNTKDKILYNKAKSIFNSRYNLYKNGKKKYTLINATLNKKNTISGYACKPFTNETQSNEPLKIALTKGGKKVLSVSASSYNKELHWLTANLKGFIGFEIEIQPDKNNQFSISVEESEQTIIL